MKLLLTRHGQSLWQTLGEAAGLDAPLSPLGVAQAHRLGAYLARYEPPARISASPLLRARQTAEIVARYLDAPVTCDNDLREFESWDASDPPSPVDMWRTMAAAPPHPAYTAFRERVQGALERVIGATPAAEEVVLVVAHGGTLGTLLRLLLDSATMRIWTPNTALHSLRWTGDFWLLRYVNQQEHLPRPLQSR